ncbi:TetR family transcriptional regulator [Paenibacillus sp. LMG 31458]|uniref:TetR family transcriptional regulator n=1 Tax=Paenibacillus phytorum TaxID=2654977 RepID=A0ABX1XR06_9BACL|nr:TetR/AcrR family transcriptional regulator [Paenibacillus phytorum]NOU70978.1 TetR family transcriptional regulator [Paenibacillus phytorum]
MNAKIRYEQERRSIKSMREESIMAAAKKLFVRKGFDKTTMQEIADEVPLGIATVFRYYSKKEKLIVAIASAIIASQWEAFRSVSEMSGSCMDKLGYLFDLFISFHKEEHRENIQLIEAFESWASLAYEQEDLLEEYYAVFESNKQLFRAIIEQGRTDGSIRNDISVDDTLMTLINVFGSFAKKVSTSYNLVVFKENTGTTVQLQVLKNVFLDYLQPSSNA